MTGCVWMGSKTPGTTGDKLLGDNLEWVSTQGSWFKNFICRAFFSPGVSTAAPSCLSSVSFWCQLMFDYVRLTCLTGLLSLILFAWKSVFSRSKATSTMQGKASLGGAGSRTLLTFNPFQTSHACWAWYTLEVCSTCPKARPGRQQGWSWGFPQRSQTAQCIQMQGEFSSGMPFASYETTIQSLCFISRLPFPCSTPQGPAELAPALPPCFGPCLSVCLSSSLQAAKPQLMQQQPAGDDS